MVMVAGNIDKVNMAEKECSVEATFAIGKVNLILDNKWKSIKMFYLYIRTHCLVDVIEQNKAKKSHSFLKRLHWKVLKFLKKLIENEKPWASKKQHF